MTREEIMRLVNEEFPYGVGLTEDTLNERPMTGEEGFRLSRDEFKERMQRSKELKPKKELFHQLIAEQAGDLTKKKYISVEDHEESMRNLRLEVGREMRLQFNRERSYSHSRGEGFNRKSDETDNTVNELNEITQQANNNTMISNITVIDTMI